MTLKTKIYMAVVALLTLLAASPWFIPVGEACCDNSGSLG